MTDRDAGGRFILYAVKPLHFVSPERRSGVQFAIGSDGRPSGTVAGHFPLVKMD